MAVFWTSRHLNESSKNGREHLGRSTEIDTARGKNYFFRTLTTYSIDTKRLSHDQDQMRLVNNSEIISLRKLIAIIFIEVKLTVIELSFMESSKNF